MIAIGILKIEQGDVLHLTECLKKLPSFMQEKITNYPRQDEQFRSVLARLILKQLLLEQGFHDAVLEDYQTDEYGRPFINEDFDFSISHADDYVMCAVSETTRVGIDVEKLRNICIDDYSISLSDKELEDLTKSENPIPDFFTLWTKKEAISKANGKGLAILLPEMEIGLDSATCGQTIWNLKELPINAEYATHIAFSGSNELKIKEFKLTEFIDVK
jgi:4'-phosphopantetheinyl transferase